MLTLNEIYKRINNYKKLLSIIKVIVFSFISILTYFNPYLFTLCLDNLYLLVSYALGINAICIVCYYIFIIFFVFK